MEEERTRGAGEGGRNNGEKPERAEERREENGKGGLEDRSEARRNNLTEGRKEGQRR